MFRRLPTQPGELPRVTPVPHFAATHEIYLPALGQALLFQTNYAPLMAAAVDTFARFPPPVMPDSAPLLVQVFVDESIGHRTPNQARRSVAVFNQRHLVTLKIGDDNTAVADLNAGFAYAVLSPDYAADIASVRYAVIEALPQILLGGRGYVAIHAACVVKDGSSILLCAPAGTGKSTLAFACLTHGFQILAEDVVQVQIQPQTMRLWGIPWKFHLLPDSLRFFPDLPLDQPRIQSNGEWKIEIELDAFYPGSTITEALPGAVVFLDRQSDSSTRLERISFAEASTRFEPIWAWDIPWQPHFERQLASLLKRQTYRLVMDGSPHQAARLLKNLTIESQ